MQGVGFKVVQYLGLFPLMVIPSVAAGVAVHVGILHVHWVPVPCTTDVSADAFLFPITLLTTAPPVALGAFPVHALAADWVTRPARA